MKIMMKLSEVAGKIPALAAEFCRWPAEKNFAANAGLIPHSATNASRSRQTATECP
jgi:hypothetical protein